MSVYRFTILLSASVPQRGRAKSYQRIPNAQVQIESAVIGLARSVFQAGGRLVFGGHPSITPLVAMIASEFMQHRTAEKPGDTESTYEAPVVVYQSAAFVKELSGDVALMQQMGYAEVIVTPAVDGEAYDPAIKDRPQCPRSVELMRRRMMTGRIEAMVCAGGMEGTEEEYRLFTELHPQGLRFLLETSGGASALLAERARSSGLDRVPDRGIDTSFPFPEDEKTAYETPMEPYGYVTSEIVQTVLGNIG